MLRQPFSKRNVSNRWRRSSMNWTLHVNRPKAIDSEHSPKPKPTPLLFPKNASGVKRPYAWTLVNLNRCRLRLSTRLMPHYRKPKPTTMRQNKNCVTSSHRPAAIANGARWRAALRKSSISTRTAFLRSSLRLRLTSCLSLLRLEAFFICSAPLHLRHRYRLRLRNRIFRHLRPLQSATSRARSGSSRA